MAETWCNLTNISLHSHTQETEKKKKGCENRCEVLS